MSTRIAVPTPARAERAAREWNEQHKPGKLVEVTLDDGSLKETYTVSDAWVLGGHTAVVKINGISGAYALNRVRPRTDDTVPYEPQQKSAPQSAEVWKKLAQKCTKDSMQALDRRLFEIDSSQLTVRQAAIVEAMLYSCIVSAYHSVAEEAVAGVDVTGALHAGDV